MGEVLKWFKGSESGVGYDVSVWKGALKDVEDLEAMTALGMKVYSDCAKAAGSVMGSEMEKAVAAFAHVLHHMADNMDSSMMAELVWLLEEGWTVNERAFWESPEAILGGYRSSVTQDRADPLVIERIGRDLLSVARPNLVRLVWAMLVADGRKLDLRGVELADRTGDSMIVPLALLDRLLAEGVPGMLDEDETAGLLHLARTLSIGSKEGIETDELLQAVLERAYMHENGGAFVWPYLRSEDGIYLSPSALRDMAARTAQALSALIAFKVMLVAMVIGEHGRLAVNFPKKHKERRKEAD